MRNFQKFDILIIETCLGPFHTVIQPKSEGKYGPTKKSLPRFLKLRTKVKVLNGLEFEFEKVCVSI